MEELRGILAQQCEDGVLGLLTQVVVVGCIESLDDQSLHSIHSKYIYNTANCSTTIIPTRTEGIGEIDAGLDLED